MRVRLDRLRLRLRHEEDRERACATMVKTCDVLEAIVVRVGPGAAQVPGREQDGAVTATAGSERADRGRSRASPPCGAPGPFPVRGRQGGVLV
ncbi:hypothetical protein [Streptomyces sp. S1]|uniref:hypothetical protein n=1 Tax=unclassified Streptomyces TaxID=2593676 RepID=UPI0013CE6880|nr:hypothetical protein [Streptomyces sp. S1]